jgi:hypothetical protein
LAASTIVIKIVETSYYFKDKLKPLAVAIVNGVASVLWIAVVGVVFTAGGIFMVDIPDSSLIKAVLPATVTFLMLAL